MLNGGSPNGSVGTVVDDVGMQNAGGVVVDGEDSVLFDDMLRNLLRANVPIVVSPLSIKVYISDRVLTNNL